MISTPTGAALALAALALACHPAVDAPAVPLYPNSETMRLPRSQIAQISGPIAKIDGREVVSQGGWFELLPGCHVVELDRRDAGNDIALSSAVYVSGQFSGTIYAMRMKAGARYIIRRDLTEGLGNTVRVVLSAREEEASGAATDLDPARSAEDLKACKEWETTALAR